MCKKRKNVTPFFRNNVTTLANRAYIFFQKYVMNLMKSLNKTSFIKLYKITKIPMSKQKSEAYK